MPNLRGHGPENNKRVATMLDTAVSDEVVLVYEDEQGNAFVRPLKASDVEKVK